MKTNYPKLYIHPSCELAYPTYLNVEKYGRIPFVDNLEAKGVDSTGKFFTSRGIVDLNDGNFLDIKVESYEGIVETEIISTWKAVKLIVQYQKFELLNEFDHDNEAHTIASGF